MFLAMPFLIICSAKVLAQGYKDEHTDVFAAALFIVIKIHDNLNILGNIDEIVIYPNQEILRCSLNE